MNGIIKQNAQHVHIHRASSSFFFFFFSHSGWLLLLYWFRWIWWICALPETDLKTVSVCAMRMWSLIAQCVTLFKFDSIIYIFFHGGILSLSGRYTLKNDQKWEENAVSVLLVNWAQHYTINRLNHFCLEFLLDPRFFRSSTRTVALLFSSIICFFCVIWNNDE